ncbi:unnamed protein product [Peniophora sp. CBMAI 1063]|nr:unnamed protein product [Peniophora sp. CBMAI 1063]
MQFLTLITIAFSTAATALAAPPSEHGPWHHGTPSAAIALAKSSATKTSSKTHSVTATATSATTAATSTTTYLSGTNTGDGTYYATGLGACGWTNSDTDYIVAVSKDLYDNYPGATDDTNSNPVCGQKITASYNGNSVTVEVVDRCEGCSLTSLDFSPSAFTQLADESVGLLEGMTWTWA